MKPVKQGDLDCLCGVYAIINCLDLVGLKRPRLKLHKDAFGSAIRALKPKLLKGALLEGIEASDLVRVARLVLESLQLSQAVKFEVSRPFVRSRFRSMPQFLHPLNELIESENTAVIINIVTPKYEHWTVAERLGAGELAVRDSGPLRALDLTRFSVGRGRYRIRADCTILIRRV